MITPITEQVAIGDSMDARRADNHRFDAVLCVAIDFDWQDTPLMLSFCYADATLSLAKK